MNKNFIFFGCWNDGYCDISNPDNNGVSSVFHHLLKAPNPSFYVVGGDNYYPDKYETKEGDKIKILNNENFESGMNCLIELVNNKAPVFLLMGNHDLQKEIPIVNINDYNPKSKDFNPSNYNIELLSLNSCKIMELQSVYKDFFKYERFGRLLGENTLLLFINSMFYTKARNDIFECFRLYRYGERYEKFKNKIENLISYEEAIIKFFCDIIRKTYPINNIIIIGHEPILSRRIKEKNEKVEEVYLPLDELGLHFLSDIYDIFHDCNKYYLCADVHQYQEADIILNQRHNIKQFVVGTGGTNCDDKSCPPNDKEYVNPLLEDSEITLLFKLNRCKRSFGYLDVNNNQGNLEFNFVETGDCKLNKKKKK